ncbi:MAG: tRNA (adenosine(37)-N6)-threonylcarbamoyltransferase complex transferase subunit TsaD [Chloroflexota bacterium]
MKVLGIETSCDETAAAVVAEGKHLLSNVIASQVDIHARYGGIVPEVASRQHLLSIVPITRQAMEQAGVRWKDLSAIAVTVGPGLVGSLLVGANFAKALAMAHGLPLVGVNHLEAHIYANWLGRQEPPIFPALCLIVSGGHSDLLLMRGHGDYLKLGRTRDDAAGEAFDKAARILGLGYPGGPAIQEAAKGAQPHPPLPRAWLKGTDDFSFSGLKTALVHLVRREGGVPGFSAQDVAAAFQEAVVEVLATKTVDAALRHGAAQIMLVGGVAANSALRERLCRISPRHIGVLFPPPVLCTDNAAMVAACGFYRLQAGTSGLGLDVSASLGFT